MGVFIFSPDQGCNEDESTNRTKPKVSCLGWHVCVQDAETPSHPLPVSAPPLGTLFHKNSNHWIAVTHYIFLSRSAIPARTQTACTPASQKQFSVLAELLEWAHDKPSNTAGPVSELCAQVLWKQRQKYQVKKIPTRTENS